jgi:hypothetical protein
MPLPMTDLVPVACTPAAGWEKGRFKSYDEDECLRRTARPD